MDLFGPVTPVRIRDKKYTLVIVDDYSRYTWTIFIANKSDVKTELPKLLKRLSVEKGDKIQRIRSDRGT